jgi:hypothetical protein
VGHLTGHTGLFEKMTDHRQLFVEVSGMSSLDATMTVSIRPELAGLPGQMRAESVPGIANSLKVQETALPACGHGKNGTALAKYSLRSVPQTAKGGGPHRFDGSRAHLPLRITLSASSSLEPVSIAQIPVATVSIAPLLPAHSCLLYCNECSRRLDADQRC